MAAIAGDLVNIEEVLCSMQAVESFFPIQYEPTAIFKATTWSSNKSLMTHLEHGSSELQSILNADDSDCPPTS